jgi:hypothetical protein
VPFLPFVLAAVSPSALAAEVQFDGFYRARGRAFDTLTLDRDHAQNEGFTLYAEHRLWLAPRFLLSDKVGVYVEIRGLDGVVWGDQASAVPDPAEHDIRPKVPELALTSPTSTSNADDQLLDITLWRAYGKVDTKIGAFTFGRVPLHWGAGVWLNDGIQVDPDYADFGDTTDRVMWELLVRDQFYVSGAVDMPIENFVNESDDTTGYSLSAGYRTESVRMGLLARLDYTAPRVIDTQDVGPLSIVTADATARATLGKLEIEAELVGQFGGGDIDTNFNDVQVLAFGGVLHANMEFDDWQINLRGGFATGDKAPLDNNIKRYQFDRDYSVGMFMFEQPMPVLAQQGAAANEENGGRDFTNALTGDALGNALFIKPTLSRRIVDGLWVDGSWFYARTARTIQEVEFEDLRQYGNEAQIGVRMTAIDHFELGAQLGVFVPGNAYRIDVDNLTLEAEFNEPAFGGQLTGRVVF